MINVTVLILAKNEEKNMKECLETVSFAEEVIVIDDFSTDKTKEIAENMGAKVIQRSMAGDWGAQQTFAVQQAKHEWIFFLDADERVTPPLVEAIRKIVNKNEKYAYWIKRHNQFRYYKATHGSFRPDDVCRLMPKKDTSVVGLSILPLCILMKRDILKNIFCTIRMITGNSICKKRIDIPH